MEARERPACSRLPDPDYSQRRPGQAERCVRNCTRDACIGFGQAGCPSWDRGREATDEIQMVANDSSKPFDQQLGRIRCRLRLADDELDIDGCTAGHCGAEVGQERDDERKRGQEAEPRLCSVVSVWPEGRDRVRMRSLQLRLPIGSTKPGPKPGHH